MNKILIFGGAFDPPHIEHVNIIKNAIEELCADKIILTPSWNSPHKTLSTPFERRVKMLYNLFAEDDRIIIDEIEKEIGGKNYTVLMLPELRKKYGEFSYLLGGDGLLSLERWYSFTEIFEYPLVVVARGSDMQKVAKKIAEFRANYGANITLLEYRGRVVSSGYIRGLIELGAWARADSFITEKNMEYILDNQLYRSRKELVERVFSTFSERLKIHTTNTILMALIINTGLALPYEKVFLSALLHDIAKHTEYTGNEQIPKNAIGTAVQHQFLGAIIAETEYGITDIDILSAIKYHTTSRVGATPLEKLLYCADMLEENRTFQGVEGLRLLAQTDFDECYRQCIVCSYNYLVSSGAEKYPLTTEAYNSITKKTE